VGDLGVDRRIILELKVWTGCICAREGPVVGSCEHGNELLGSIKGGEFLD
jgi:hypothetical protein